MVTVVKIIIIIIVIVIIKIGPSLDSTSCVSQTKIEMPFLVPEPPCWYHELAVTSNPEELLHMGPISPDERSRSSELVCFL